MGSWDAFGSPGTGGTAAERIELANIQAGLGTDKERARAKKKEEKKKQKRRIAKAEAAAIAMGTAEVPMWSDPRFIGGGLLLTGVVVAIWYTKKKSTKRKSISRSK